MSHILHNSSEGKLEGSPILVEVSRYDPERDHEQYMQKYEIPYRKRFSVFTLLREIYERQDPTLAFRNQQCGRGICGLCQMQIEVNGKKRRLKNTCKMPVEAGDHVKIYPRNRKKVIRDLVVEREL